MDFSPETYDAAERFFAQQWQRGLIPGYLGKPGADGTYEFFVSGNPGRQYVRIWRGDQMTITTCTNDRAPLEPNNLVWLRRFHGELVVERSDPSTARIIYGDNVGAAGVPNHVVPPSSDLVVAERILPGLLRASLKTDVPRIHIEDFEYDGGRYQSDPYGADDPDVSSYFPATTDYYGIVGVYLDPLDGSIVAFAGEDHAALADFTYTDRDNVPAGMYPVGAVLVQESGTITDANTFFDWRLHHARRGFLRTSSLNISATPTVSELDAEFGAASTQQDGFAVVIDDNAGGANYWLVWAQNSEWVGIQGTILT